MVGSAVSSWVSPRSPHLSFRVKTHAPTVVLNRLLPLEEVAQRRLALFVNSYTLLLKNLMEEGVALEKVKAASDKTWRSIGQSAGAELKPLYENASASDMVQQTGSMAAEIHGMAIRREAAEGAHRIEFASCPWNEAAESLSLPENWRLCKSGHDQFVNAMYQAINPGVSMIIDETASGGAVCSETIRY